MGTPMPAALADTVRAWDRSGMGCDRESVLWDLDSRLNISDPIGVKEAELHAARTRVPYVAASGWACTGGVGLLGLTDGGGSGSGESCSGGCSGGGCGSGCGGGGS
jgi:hypothetical protein